MQSRDFAYWLQGFFELSDPGQGLTERQVLIIKNHLNMVFFHEIDPSHKSPPSPDAHQQQLNHLHDGEKTELHGPVLRC